MEEKRNTGGNQDDFIEFDVIARSLSQTFVTFLIYVFAFIKKRKVVLIIAFVIGLAFSMTSSFLGFEKKLRYECSMVLYSKYLPSEVIEDAFLELDKLVISAGDDTGLATKFNISANDLSHVRSISVDTLSYVTIKRPEEEQTSFDVKEDETKSDIYEDGHLFKVVIVVSKDSFPYAKLQQGIVNYVGSSAFVRRLYFQDSVGLVRRIAKVTRQLDQVDSLKRAYYLGGSNLQSFVVKRDKSDAIMAIADPARVFQHDSKLYERLMEYNSELSSLERVSVVRDLSTPMVIPTYEDKLGAEREIQLALLLNALRLGIVFGLIVAFYFALKSLGKYLSDVEKKKLGDSE